MFITADLNLISARKPARPCVIRWQLRLLPDGVKNSTHRCASSSTQRWVLEAGFSRGLRRIYWSRCFISTFRCSVFSPAHTLDYDMCHLSRWDFRGGSGGLDNRNPAQLVRNRALSLNIICNVLLKTMQKRRQKNERMSFIFPISFNLFIYPFIYYAFIIINYS